MVDDAEKLIARKPQEFVEKQNIDVKVQHEVLEIDLNRNRILVRSQGEGDSWWEPFDRLMLATGALPIRPSVAGADAEGIFGVNTLASGLALRRFIEEVQPKRAAVIGGGYIGLEMAENLVRRGLKVSLVEREEEVMNTLDADMGRLVSEALMEIDVKLYRRESLEAFDVGNGRVRAVITDRRSLPVDLVVLGIGVKPNSALAEQAGIPLGEQGAVKVDDRMQTAAANVWAGGDCAESFHLVSRQPVYIALGTVANKHGRVAGANIAGGRERFPGVVGTAASKVCKVEVARTGLQEKEIARLGLAYVAGKIESTTRADYYPHSGPITVKILAEKGGGRLLGGQIVGREGAAKRIDILATALHAGLTLDEMVHLDLSYAPPYSPLWDPVLIGVRIAAKQL